MNAEKDAAEVLRDTFEQRAIWAAALIAARSTPEIERFATWVMGITGAAFALIIGNLDKGVALIGTWGTAFTILMMLLSAYFGFVVRIQAYQIRIYLNLHDDKSMQVGAAYEEAGGRLKLRNEAIDAGVRTIISPDIDQLSWFGRAVWRLIDWVIGLPAPKPDLDGVAEEDTGAKETAYRASTVIRCAVWQMACLFVAVLGSVAALLWHWTYGAPSADPWAAWAAWWASGAR
jgi:hypothetical protein